MGSRLPDWLQLTRGGAWSLKAEGGWGRARGGVKDGNASSRLRRLVLRLSLGFSEGSDLRVGVSL